jgi:hypothetical protein
MKFYSIVLAMSASCVSASAFASSLGVALMTFTSFVTALPEPQRGRHFRPVAKETPVSKVIS